jgi:hypothetical protein
MGLKKAQKYKAQANKEINKKNLCITLVIIQFHFKMHGPYNIKFSLPTVLHTDLTSSSFISHIGSLLQAGHIFQNSALSYIL